MNFLIYSIFSYRLREENRQIIEDKDAILQRHQSQIDNRDRQIASLVKEKCDIQNSEIRVRSEFKQQVDVVSIISKHIKKIVNTHFFTRLPG